MNFFVRCMALVVFWLAALLPGSALAHDAWGTSSYPQFDGYHWRGWNPSARSWTGITVKYYLPSVTWAQDGTHGVVALAAWYRQVEMDAVSTESGQYRITSNQPQWGTVVRDGISPNSYYWLRVVSCDSGVNVCARYSFDGINYTQHIKVPATGSDPVNSYFEVIAGRDSSDHAYDCHQGGTHPKLNSAAKAVQTQVFDGTSWVTPGNANFYEHDDPGTTHYPDSWISGTTNGWQVTGGGNTITCSK